MSVIFQLFQVIKVRAKKYMEKKHSDGNIGLQLFRVIIGSYLTT